MPTRASTPLTFAIPKGRVARALEPVFAAWGVPQNALDADRDRTLVRTFQLPGHIPLRFLLLKPDDVPTYVEYGAADLGVVGRDVLLERGYDLAVPVDLGIGVCRMVVAGKALPKGTTKEHWPRQWASKDGAPLRIATKYPRIARQHFDARGLGAEIVFVQGSVELAPTVGLADVIVDIVESGSTLRENQLIEYETIAEIRSVVAVNRAALKLRFSAIEQVLRALAEFSDQKRARRS